MKERDIRPSRDRDLWEGEYFIDIQSDSRRRPPPATGNRPSTKRKVSAGDRGTKGQDLSNSQRRSSQTRRPAQMPSTGGKSQRLSVKPSEHPGERRPQGKGRKGETRKRPPADRQYQRRQQRPMGKKARALVGIFTFLITLTAFILLCVFLLFRISRVEVTGDLIYDEQEILKLCGYQGGENLVFAPVEDQQRLLEKELPYIERAKITKHLPGTIRVEITGARLGACLENGGSWLYLSETGKILDRKAEAPEGVMQVVGIVPKDNTLGTHLQLADESQEAAYQEIMEELVKLNAAAQFTKLDLTDIYNLRLWYEDRIEFRLGSAADLAYKVGFGYDTVSDRVHNYIGQEEHGVLDLSVANEANHSTFTADKSGGGASGKADSEESGEVSPEGSTPGAGDQQGENSGEEGETQDWNGEEETGVAPAGEEGVE